MKRILTCLLIMICTVLFNVNSILAQDYQHQISEKDITFAWSLDGESLIVKISAETTGWVGIGFNPSEKMKDANFIIGYVKKGKVTLKDDYGDEENGHEDDDKIGGSSDVTLISGTEKGKTTTLEFSLPLNSGDKYDGTIDPAGKTVVLLAYGGKRDSFRSKHKFRKALTVNLSSGKVE